MTLDNHSAKYLLTKQNSQNPEVKNVSRDNSKDKGA